MKILRTVAEMRHYVMGATLEGKSIGFVPTMGFLHAGHLSLIAASKNDNQLTIVSIFVNPIQFGPNEDFDKYPRDFRHDERLLENAGVDVVFYPELTEMYPRKNEVSFEFNSLDKCLCGLKRPGHFQGVALVVSKLFNIVKPRRAYFGQKDYQQTVVVKKLVEDLNFELDVVVCPTVREPDGLALSSRNVFLNTDERREAAILYQALQTGKKLIQQQVELESVRLSVIDYITQSSLVKIDYVEIRGAVDLLDLIGIVDVGLRPLVILVAVFLGKTRLIDNIVVE